MGDPNVRELPAPINDENLEKWMVQYQYGAGIVIGPICRDDFGAILARLAKAEADLAAARAEVERLTDRAKEAFVLERLVHDEKKFSAAALSREAGMREALGKWECMNCGGTGRLEAHRVGGYKDPGGRKCEVCRGSGLHRLALAALSADAKGGECGKCPLNDGRECGEADACAADTHHRATTGETHEQRWARLGWPFSWNEKERAYTCECRLGMISVPTVAAVDEWIAAHAKGGVE